MKPLVPTLMPLLSAALAGCAAVSLAPASTAPPIPATLKAVGSTSVATSIPPRPATQLASDKLGASTVGQVVLFTLPGIDQVVVANVPYKTKAASQLTLDLYYPPGFDFVEPAPFVLFVNGIGDSKAKTELGSTLKEDRASISWAQLVAASGVVGVNYEAGMFPLQDTRDLLAFIRDNAAWLRLDASRMCLFSASANTPVALALLSDADFQENVSCAVVYYGTTIASLPLPPGGPLLVVKAGQDDRALNEGLDQLVASAQAAGMTVEFIEYEEGQHAFEIAQDTDTTREIVRRTLDFLAVSLRAP